MEEVMEVTEVMEAMEVTEGMEDTTAVKEAGDMDVKAEARLIYQQSDIS